LTSTSIVASVRAFLSEHAPFSRMAAADVEFVARNVELAYFAGGEVVLAPSSGAPEACLIVRQGLVEGLRPRLAGAPAASDDAVIHLTPGEPFPVGALLAGRPVSATYRASGDVFCWRLERVHFDELTRRSAPFLDFCRRRMGALLDLSQEALQASYAAQATQWRAMSLPLDSVLAREPVTCTAGERLREVFERMERERVGSVVVVGGPGGAPVEGIFTRQDVVGRIVLPGLPLDTRVGDVMTAPAVTLEASASVGDAMLTMAEHTVRHLPVTREGRLVGIVTERDLFVLQRRSLRQIGDSIRLARDVVQLRATVEDIRQWGWTLVAQGVSAELATRLISRLNDQVCVRLVALAARAADVELERVCWLALGSEGRQEQTIATDQDNGLVHDGTLDEARLLAFAGQVNRDLDACGYPLCKGGVMAGNPRWCMSAGQWADCFEAWIDRGDPDSLLAASIFFDFRGIAGDVSMAARLRTHVTALAQANRRFLKQMSDNALRSSPPLAWSGGMLEQLFAAQALDIDLKSSGTSAFVDGARLLALAHGVAATGTSRRLAALAEQGAVPADEARAWIDAFHFLQSLRLRVQQRPVGDRANPNLLDTRALSELDRRILKEALRQARKLQQRLALDFPG